MKTLSLKTLTIVAAAALLAPAGNVVQQAQSQQQQAPVPTAKLNLTMEQRHVIKEIIKDQKVANAAANVNVAVGNVVPSSVELRAMPLDISKQVSQIRSHVFFLKNDQIVIVDPKDNRIVEVIE